MLRAVERTLADADRDLPFGLVYLFDDDAGPARLAASAGAARGSAIAAEVIEPGAGPWPLDRVRAGETVLVEGLGARIDGDLPRGAWDRPATQAVLVPLAAASGGRGRRVAGVLVAGVNPHRRVRRAHLELPAAARRPDHGGPRPRGRLRGRTAPRRGARRARPREDRLLLQRQPRVPHPADPDHGPGRGAARRARGGPRALARRARGGAPQRAAPRADGQQPARLLAARGRPPPDPPRARRPRLGHRGARGGVRVRDGAGGPRLRRRLPAGAAGRSCSTGTRGRRSCSTCSPTR